MENNRKLVYMRLIHGTNMQNVFAKPTYFDADITSIVFKSFDARILENGKVFPYLFSIDLKAINFSGIVRGNFSKSASSESILMRPFVQYIF